jgi:hypothetical protein
MKPMPIAVVAAVLAAGTLCGQDGDDALLPVKAGTRVRLQAADAQGGETFITGRLLDFTTEQVAIEAARGRIITIPRGRVTDLAISGGRPRRWKRALVGAAVGAAMAGVVGLASGDDTDCAWVCFTGPQKAAIFGMLFTPVGALIGAATPGNEQWHPIPLPGSARSRGPRGVTLVRLRW